MKKILSTIAYLQHKIPLLFLLIILVISVFIGLGVPKIEVESDFSEEQPRHLPAYQRVDRISEEFGGEDAVLLLVEVEKSDEVQRIDLRDPEIITYMQDIEKEFIEQSEVTSISSFASSNAVDNLQSRDEVISFIKQNPSYSQFFSRDYRSTLITLTTDIGGAYDDIVPFERMIEEKLSSLNTPGGITTTITGGPSFGKLIHEFVIQDALYTILIAAAAIFILLLIIQKSLKKSVLVFIPLLFGLLWTGGTLGHLGIKLSIATVGLGSIILGLGVEYGVFMVSRFNEEKNKGKSQLEAAQETVGNIGKAILSSGTTTIAGFLALTFSITPMMQKLGMSLALGIFFSIIAAIIVTPLLFIIADNCAQYLQQKKEVKQ